MPLKLVRTEKTNQEELNRFKADQEDFEWFSENAKKIEEKYRGKFVAILNKEIFVGDSFKEAERKAKEKHPERDPYVDYIPLKQRIMVL